MLHELIPTRVVGKTANPSKCLLTSKAADDGDLLDFAEGSRCSPLLLRGFMSEQRAGKEGNHLTCPNVILTIYFQYELGLGGMALGYEGRLVYYCSWGQILESRERHQMGLSWHMSASNPQSASRNHLLSWALWFAVCHIDGML